MNPRFSFLHPLPSKFIGYAVLLFYCFFVMSSCKLQEPSWDVDLLTPIAKTNLSLDDALQDDILQSDSTGLLKMVYSKNLFGLNKSSFFQFYDTGITKTFTIDSLSLYNTTITYPITLGALARQAGAAGQIIILFQGQMLAIPAVGPLSSGDILLNADTLFQSMTLNNGKMDISLTNGLPIEVRDVQFELRNEINNQIIVQGLFPSIGVGKTETQKFDLAGKTIYSKIIARVTGLSSPGSNGMPVLIDTAAQIKAEIKVYELFPSTATAIWPSQNLVNETTDFYIDRIPVQIHYAKMRKGRLKVNMFSTLQDSIYITYHLQAATKNNIPFVFYTTLPPAPPGGFSKSTEIYSFDDYDVDMRGMNKDTFNSLQNTIIAAIESTGVMKMISKSDSLTVTIQFEEIDPEYVRGYMLDTLFTFGPDVTTLDIFKNIAADKLDMKGARLLLRAENSMGVDTEFKLNSLVAKNTNNSKSVTLTGEPVTKSYFIPRAIDNLGHLPVQSNTLELVVDDKNSNLNALISILPNSIEHEFQFHMNPFGNVSNNNDFIYSDKLLDVNLEVEVPLYFSATGMELCDTTSIDVNANEWSKVESGFLKVIAQNEYPLDANIRLILLDESGKTIDTIFMPTDIIHAGDIDGSGRVSIPKETILSIPVNQELVQNISKSKNMKVWVVLHTKPDNTAIKLYRDYSIEVKLIADVTYRVE